MSGKPAARLGDSSACPKTGHGNNPIASGSPDVFFDGLPAARAGDSTGCGSTLSSNLVPNVLINGKPAATLGSLGDHGSVVIGGSGTVIIGTSHTPSPFVPPEPLNIATSAHAMLASPALPQRSAIPMARAWQEEPGDLAPLGLEEEDEEEELGDQPQQLERQAITLRIGVFFDGTGNNAANSAIGAQCRAPALGLDEQEALAMVQRCEAHHLDPDSSYANDVSNIWRLYDLYQEDSKARAVAGELTAYFRVYVTGIGTATGKPDTLFPGQAFGRGATGVLAKVDEGLALLEKALVSFNDENAESTLAGLELDIFGFSRGAAAARHFANQILLREQGPLGKLHRTGKLGLATGFDWRDAVVINFIGLFDTVAAIGGWDDWVISAMTSTAESISIWRPMRPARWCIWSPATNTGATSPSTRYPRRTGRSCCPAPIRTWAAATSHCAASGSTRYAHAATGSAERPPHPTPWPTNRRSRTPNSPARPTCSTRKTVPRSWERTSGSTSCRSPVGAAIR